MGKSELRIRELRTRKGVSQAELAALLEVKPAAVSKYETGRNFLSLGQIKFLCNYFEVTSDYLLGISDDNRKSEDKIADLEKQQKLLIERITHMENILSRLESYYKKINDPEYNRTPNH